LALRLFAKTLSWFNLRKSAKSADKFNPQISQIYADLKHQGNTTKNFGLSVGLLMGSCFSG